MLVTAIWLACLRTFEKGAAWGNVAVYFDFQDWWIGYYRKRSRQFVRGDHGRHYVCLIPTLVISWPMRPKRGKSEAR